MEDRHSIRPNVLLGYPIRGCRAKQIVESRSRWILGESSKMRAT
jgi:hypothetical protein